jgi:uncharacterized membrane protein (UPF0127 family)
LQEESKMVQLNSFAWKRPKILQSQVTIRGLLDRLNRRLSIALVVGWGAMSLYLISQQGPMSPVSELPQSAVITLESGETIALRVAQTRAAQVRGWRDPAMRNHAEGLLFPTSAQERPEVWMWGVAQSLDVWFVRDGEVVEVAPNLPPCREQPCVTYSLSEPVDGVVEVAGGSRARLGVSRGDRITIETFAASHPYQISSAAVLGLLGRLWR